MPPWPKTGAEADAPAKSSARTHAVLLPTEISTPCFVSTTRPSADLELRPVLQESTTVAAPAARAAHSAATFPVSVALRSWSRRRGSSKLDARRWVPAARAARKAAKSARWAAASCWSSKLCASASAFSLSAAIRSGQKSISLTCKRRVATRGSSCTADFAWIASVLQDASTGFAPPRKRRARHLSPLEELLLPAL